MSSNSKEDAFKWLRLIEQLPSTDENFWRFIQSHTNENEILVESEILNILNTHFSQYNIPKIIKKIAITTEVDDLPF